MEPRRRAGHCILCAVALGALALGAMATRVAAQEEEVKADPLAAPLAAPLAKAAKDNQRLLVHLTGGDATIGAALDKAIADYRSLGKLIRYEYQHVSVAGDSAQGKELAERIGIAGADESSLPNLAVLAADGKVLALLSPSDMTENGKLDLAAVRRYLEAHQAPPLQARKVLAAGIALAEKTRRQVFVFLSAPW